MAVDITLMGPGQLSDWPSVLGKAAATGIDPNSLYVGTDGLVYGAQSGNWMILGSWGGDPAFKTGQPPSSGRSSTGSPGAALGLFSLPSIPWWIWALLAVGVVVVIREA
jgi:hypothetical protein